MASLASVLEEDEVGASSQQHRTKCTAKRIGYSFLISIVVVLVVIFHHIVKKALHVFVGWCNVLGPFAVVVYGLVVTMLTLCMLPVFPLMVGAGIVFPAMYPWPMGLFVGIIVVFGGLWIGSMLAFQLGRTCLKRFATKKMEGIAWATVVNLMIDDNGWWVVLLARMSPVIPAEIFNYACSLTSVSLPGYGVGCLGSIVPVGIWVGATATGKGLANKGGFFFILCNAVFLAVLSLILYIAFKKYEAKVKLLARDVVRHGDNTRTLDENMQAMCERKLTRAASSFSPINNDNFAGQAAETALNVCHADRRSSF